MWKKTDVKVGEERIGEPCASWVAPTREAVHYYFSPRHHKQSPHYPCGAGGVPVFLAQEEVFLLRE